MKIANENLFAIMLMRTKDIHNRFSQRDDEYDFYEKLFQKLPTPIKKHRVFFSKKRRGFGENAFHAMWTKIFADYKPQSLLEVGVYRGQTISLWALLSEIYGIKSAIHGISPFSSAGDEVSTYTNIDFKNDVNSNFSHFGLPSATLHEGYSTDSAMIDVFGVDRWDLIYIDGSHDEEVVRSDYNLAKQGLKPGGILVFDDSSLNTNFTGGKKRFKGHPGPSRIVTEIDKTCFSQIAAVGHNNVFQKIRAKQLRSE